MKILGSNSKDRKKIILRASLIEMNFVLCEFIFNQVSIQILYEEPKKIVDHLKSKKLNFGASDLMILNMKESQLFHQTCW